MLSKVNQAENAADQRSLWNLKKSGTMMDYLPEGTIFNGVNWLDKQCRAPYSCHLMKILLVSTTF